MVVVTENETDEPVSDIIKENGWCHLHDIMEEFSPDIPLYKSPQDTSEHRLKFDSFSLLKCGGMSAAERSYEVKLNIWWAPAGTHCGIHNHATDPFLGMKTL